jgi:hypothetical protein
MKAKKTCPRSGQVFAISWERLRRLRSREWLGASGRRSEPVRAAAEPGGRAPAGRSAGRPRRCSSFVLHPSEADGPREPAAGLQPPPGGRGAAGTGPERTDRACWPAGRTGPRARGPMRAVGQPDGRFGRGLGTAPTTRRPPPDKST